jgi:hypothetical protein
VAVRRCGAAGASNRRPPFSLSLSAPSRSRGVAIPGRAWRRRWRRHHGTPRRSTRVAGAARGAVEWHRGGALELCACARVTWRRATGRLFLARLCRRWCGRPGRFFPFPPFSFLSVRVRVSSLSRSDLIGHLFFLFSLDFQPHDSDLHSSEAPVPLLGSIGSSRCRSVSGVLFFRYKQEVDLNGERRTRERRVEAHTFRSWQRWKKSPWRRCTAWWSGGVAVALPAAGSATLGIGQG